MKQVLVSIVLVMCVGCSSHVSKDTKDAILNWFDKKNYAMCLSMVEKNYTEEQLKIDTVVFLIKGESLYRVGRYTEAKQLLNEAKDAGFMKRELYYHWQGKVNHAMGEFEIAVLYYDSLIAATENNSAFYCERANVRSALKSYDLAFKDCYTCMLLDTTNSTLAYVNIGCIYANYEKYDSALIFLNKALEYDSVAVAFENIAVCYYRMKKHDLAIANLNQAILLDFNNPHYYFVRGNLYREIGDMEKACSDWKEALILKQVGTDREYEKYCK